MRKIIFFVFFQIIVGSSFFENVFCYEFVTGKYKNTYPSEYRLSGNECTPCPKVDANGFCQSHCTSYVAWKINEFWERIGCGGIDFNNIYLQPNFYRWSDAKKWKEAAKRANVLVLDYPIENEVAWWNHGDRGHVAFVEEIKYDENKKIKSVVISEYNFKACSFSVREIPVGDEDYPDAFIIMATNVIEIRDMGMCSEYDSSFYEDDSEPGKGGDSDDLIPSADSPTPSSSSSKPDIWIKSISFLKEKNWDSKMDSSDLIFLPDQKVIVGIKIRNAGEETDEYIYSSLYLSDGKKVDDDPKRVGDKEGTKGENLERDDSKIEYFEFHIPTDEDTYNVYARSDSGKDVSESNEDNNYSKILIFKVKRKPNFKPYSFYFENPKEYYLPDETIYVQIITENKGGDARRDVQLAYYLDNNFIGEDNMRDYNLKKGKMKGEEISFQAPQDPGIYTLSAFVDYNQKTDEEDENDNWINIIFEVREEEVIIPEPEIEPEPEPEIIPEPEIEPKPEIIPDSENDPEIIVIKWKAFLKALYSETFIKDCEHFLVIKIFEYEATGDFIIYFINAPTGSIDLIGQSRPDSGWIDYPVKFKMAFIPNWPLGSNMEFSAYYVDVNGTRQWFDASICPRCFHDDPDPMNRHFEVILE